MGKDLWVAKQVNKGITDWGRFSGLQIGAALGISNRGKKITNQGWDYKSVQNKPLVLFLKD